MVEYLIKAPGEDPSDPLPGCLDTSAALLVPGIAKALADQGSGPGVTNIVMLDGSWSNVRTMRRHFHSSICAGEGWRVEVPEIILSPTFLSCYARSTRYYQLVNPSNVEEMVRECRLHGVALMSYGPLVGVLRDSRAQELAARLKMGTSQLALRYGLQRGFAPAEQGLEWQATCSGGG